MPSIETLDGPLDLVATDDLLYDVQSALSFWYAHGRHPYRALSGMKKFIITTDDFRYVESPRFWRVTREQAEDMLHTLWPEEAAGIMRLLHQSREQA